MVTEPVELAYFKFNTKTAQRQFTRLLIKNGYVIYGSGVSLESFGFCICLAGNENQTKRVVYASIDSRYKLIRLHEIPQFELIPSSEAFTEFMRGWVPSEP